MSPLDVTSTRVTIRGPEGELRWGYLQAAALGPWTLTTNPAGGTLTATVVTADAFRVSQPTLTFRVIRQTGAPWVWPVTALHIAGDTLTASIAPQE